MAAIDHSQWHLSRLALRDTERMCRERLFGQRNTAEDLAKRLDLCLIEMGYGIYAAIADWWKLHVAACRRGEIEGATGPAPRLRDLNVFFWPGYQSRIFGERVVPRTPHGEPGGIGLVPDRLPGPRMPYPYVSHPTTLWYSRALQPWKAGFKPGSTHEWIRLMRPATDDANELTVLEITRVPPLTQAEPPKDWLTIPLSDGDESKWAKEISSHLAQRIPNVPWPQPHDGDARDDVRMALYNIWLSATFGSPALNGARLLHDLGAAIARAGVGGELEGLAASLWSVHAHEHPRSCKYHRDNPRFATWYTLAVTPPLTAPDDPDTDRNRPQELGSAMILTSVPLPVWLVCGLQQWVVSVYLSFREVENVILERYAGRQDMVGAFSHEVGNIGAQVTDGWTRRLGDVATIDNVDPAEWPADTTKFFNISCPAEFRESVAQWTICPLPAAQVGLRDILTIWGLPRTVGTVLGLGETKRVLVSDLISRLVDRAKVAAAARRRMGDAFPDQLSDVQVKQDLFYETLQGLARVSVEHEDCHPEVVINGQGDEAAEYALSLVRTLFAVLANTLVHAADETLANVTISSTDTHLRTRIVNRKGTFVGRSASRRPFQTSTFAVARYCLWPIGGRLISEPDPRASVGELVTTEFEVPYATPGSREKAPWLTRTPSRR